MKALACVCMLLMVPAVACAEDPAPAYNRVNFQVSVGQDTANDQMDATLFVEENNPDPAALARDLTDTINAAQQQAKNYPAVKVSSGNQSSWPVYGARDASGSRLQGWRGRAELKLESGDFKSVGQLIAALQNRMQLGGISFSVSDAARHAQESGLTKQAIATFQSRAELIRDAWGAKGYRMVSVDITSPDGGRSPVMYMAKAMAAAPVAEDYSAGNSRLTVTISGTIELQQQGPFAGPSP